MKLATSEIKKELSRGQEELKNSLVPRLAAMLKKGPWPLRLKFPKGLQ